MKNRVVCRPGPSGGFSASPGEALGPASVTIIMVIGARTICRRDLKVRRKHRSSRSLSRLDRGAPRIVNRGLKEGMRPILRRLLPIGSSKRAEHRDSAPKGQFHEGCKVKTHRGHCEVKGPRHEGRLRVIDCAVDRKSVLRLHGLNCANSLGSAGVGI
jgi:hypothetical protein